VGGACGVQAVFEELRVVEMPCVVKTIAWALLVNANISFVRNLFGI